MLQCQKAVSMEGYLEQERGLPAGIVVTFVALAKQADPSRFLHSFRVGL